MGDEVKQEQEVADVKADTTKPVNVDEIREQVLKETAAETDRRVGKFVTENSELRARLEELEKSSMSAKQREEYEREQVQARLNEKESKLNTLQLNMDKTTYANEAKIKTEMIDIVNGNNIDDFKMNVDKLNNLINITVEERLKDRLANGYKPGAGNQDSTGDFYTMDQIKSIDQQSLQRMKPEERDKVVDKMNRSYAKLQKG